MEEILKQINSLLYLSLKVDNEDNDDIILVTDKLEDIKDPNFTVLIQAFVKMNAITKVLFENKNGNKKIRIVLKKARILKKQLNKIGGDSSRKIYNERIDRVVYFMIFLFLSLKINGDAELDINSELTRLNLEGRPSQVLDVESVVTTAQELSNDMIVCKKFVNHMYCKPRPIESAEDIQEAAVEYSEGRKSLRNLLESLFKNKIRTIACCKGHENKAHTFGYILFDMKDSKTTHFFQSLHAAFLAPSISNNVFVPNCGFLIPGYEDCYINNSSITFSCFSADKLLADILLYTEKYNNVPSNDSNHKL